MKFSMLSAGMPASFARWSGRTLARMLTVVALAALAVTVAAPVQADDDTQRVVYHVDYADPTRYSATLTSINNLINDAEQKLQPWDVHMVLVGFGIRFSTDDPLENMPAPYAADEALDERRDELRGRLQTLMEIRDVKVHLCEVTRSEIGLDQDKLYEGIGLVGSGVAEIADLQRAGYAYLKIQ